MMLELLPIRLKTLRESNRLSQGDLAGLTGLTQSQISHYETSRAFPGLEAAVALAKAFGITVADLLGEKEPTSAPPRKPSDEEIAIWVLEKIEISKVKLDQVRHILLPFRL